MEDIKAGRVYTAGVKKNLWGRVLRKGESHRDVQTGDMYILIKSEIEFEKLWEEQYLSSGDIALIAECGTIGVTLA